MTDIAEIKSRITDWKAPLSVLGVNPRYLTGKHCPCPLCGGKDRFRYTDYLGNGDYICNQCGNGDGVDLLMKLNGYTFTDTVGVLADYLGIATDTTKTPVKTPVSRSKRVLNEKQANTPKDNIKRIQGFLWGAKPISKCSPAGNYLINRGIDWLSVCENLHSLFYSELDYWTATDDKPFKVGTYPAMIGKITDINGELMGVHITYLENRNGIFRKAEIINPNTGKRLPAKKMQTRYCGALRGASIKLYTPTDKLAVCEGIETALAVREMFSLPVWCCLSAGGLKSVALPNIKTLYIVGDNDENETGRNACRDLSNRAIASGLSVKYWQPENIGDDALDELNKRKDYNNESRK